MPEILDLFNLIEQLFFHTGMGGHAGNLALNAQKVDFFEVGIGVEGVLQLGEQFRARHELLEGLGNFLVIWRAHVGLLQVPQNFGHFRKKSDIHAEFLEQLVALEERAHGLGVFLQF